ncbi:VgrG-related protein [Crossiella cryophila]|uniref:Phage protein D n=1 Tax=Crossiella cryophila TaxID=43355 RepID=A0A7W7CF38_9PSEU|nr:VgrG-related protein [Crossiella cryophila]MBB4680008.1 phage protein D [Crossiella cryophila]
MTRSLGVLGNTPDGVTVRARVEIGPSAPAPLSAEVAARIRRVVVDTDVNLPGMFEIVFDDPEGWLVDRNRFGIGSAVSIHDGKDGKLLIRGEITSIEARCADQAILTVLRGYEKAHRLQRATRTRTFLHKLDSQIAAAIAREHDLDIGFIQPTTHLHEHLAQVAQTDWDFLRCRAREIGYETGVAGGKFFFRKPAPPGKPLLGLARAVSGQVTELTFKNDLLTFLPRMTGATLTPDVEVRVWDPWANQVRIGSARARAGTATIADDSPEGLARIFADAGKWTKASPGKGGKPPSPTAHVVVDRPLAAGVTAGAVAESVAEAIAGQLTAGYAEAEGWALGNPAVIAGGLVRIKGVPRQFEGWWAISSAQHVFDETEGGYQVRFVVSGGQDRSLHGLTSAARTEPQRFTGVVCGVVSNVSDPLRRNRVKVSLPWLSPGYESDWARVALPGAGARSGTMFLPEVKDEVLVCFEFGDLRRPYVLGGLVNQDTRYSLGGAPVRVSGQTGAVVRRGIATPTGNQLAFEDDAQARTSKVVLGGQQEDVVLSLDCAKGTVALRSQPASGAGSIIIECGATGNVQIKAGPNGTVTVDGGASLTLKAAQMVRIASNGVVEIKGSAIKLN